MTISKNSSAEQPQKRGHPIPDDARQDWLDWLRGIAILMVLASHYQINWRDAGIFVPLAALNMRIGWSGVDMFFVLSGFLVGGLLLSEKIKYGAINLPRFYVRRALKIWPLLYLAPIFYLLFSKTTGWQSQINFFDFIPVFLHVQNYFPLPAGSGHLWSLAVEEHFYLWLPIFIVLIEKFFTKTRHALVYALACMMIIVGFFRIYSVFEYNLYAQNVRILTHFRIDGLLFGVTLAWIFFYKPDLWNKLVARRLPLAILAVLFAWPFAFNPNTSPIVAGPGLTSLYLCYGCLLMLTFTFARLPHTDHLSKRPLKILAWIGRHSFPIYLFHAFVWLSFIALKGNDGPIILLGSRSIGWFAGAIIYTAISIFAGAAIGIALEKPLLKLRNRLIPRPVSALPPMRSEG